MSEYKIEWRSPRLNFGISGKTAPGKWRRKVVNARWFKFLGVEIQRHQWRKLVASYGKPSDLTEIPKPIVNESHYSVVRANLHRVPAWVEVAYRSKRFGRRRGQVDQDPGVLRPSS